MAKIRRIFRKLIKAAKGDIGLSTLIIFIAYLIVAAMAAGVLINAANLFRQQAQRSSEQILNMVSGTFAIKNVAGDRLPPKEQGLIKLVGAHITSTNVLASEYLHYSLGGTTPYGIYFNFTVKDAYRGISLNGAQVYVYFYNSNGTQLGYVSGTTNSSGEASIYVNVTSSYPTFSYVKIYVQHSGYYVPKALEINRTTLTYATNTYYDVNVSAGLIPIGQSQVYITVKDVRSNLAIQGAIVRISWEGGLSVATTGVSGKVYFRVPSGYFRISVIASDYVTLYGGPFLIGLLSNGTHVIEVMDITAYMMPVDFYANSIQYLMIKIGLMGAVTRINLGQTVIEISDGHKDVTLTFNISENMSSFLAAKYSSDASHFSAYPLLDVGGVFTPEYPIITSGDLIMIFINTTAAGLDLTPGTTVFIKIIPPNGYPVISEFTVPPFFAERYVNLGG